MFSTSMRKCSAVVCRDAPAWFAAEFLSSVFTSVPLVMVILSFFCPTVLLRFDPVNLWQNFVPSLVGPPVGALCQERRRSILDHLKKCGRATAWRRKLILN